MIMFKTEMKEMPKRCNSCTQIDACKTSKPCNISFFLCPRTDDCPLIEFITDEPKPTPAITQHEHDLLSILQKLYPNLINIGITKNDDSIYLCKRIIVPTFQRDFNYIARTTFDLFDKHKLPTLTSEFTEETFEKQYSINKLLSRPIKN